MEQALDAGALVTTMGVVGVVVLFVMQYLKQFKWFKNEWCRIVAPIVGIAITVVGIYVLGKIFMKDGYLQIEWVSLYNAVISGFSSGVAAITGYHIQKPLNLLESGMDPTKPENNELSNLISRIATDVQEKKSDG